MRKCTLYVSGTHCSSCKIFIEDILGEDTRIRNAKMDLRTKQITFETDQENPEILARTLTEKTINHGYTFSAGKAEEEKNHDLLWQAVPLWLLFLALFFILQKSGILNIGIGGPISPMSAVFIGFIASLSSCLAVVWGLILSLSAKVAKDTRGSKKPYILFHLGRLLGFAALGGLLGFLGKALGIHPFFTSLLWLLSAFVMVALGLNLMGIFQKTLTFPSHFFSAFRKIEHTTLAPILLGIGTFFLPCGFTQSMQVAALSSGSGISGALIMISFALGTLPVLSALSFGSASFSRSRHAPLFFRTTGVVVFGFGLVALLTGLTAIWVIAPLFTF